jgi:hypothetical protein
MEQQGHKSKWQIGNPMTGKRPIGRSRWPDHLPAADLKAGQTAGGHPEQPGISKDNLNQLSGKIR